MLVTTTSSGNSLNLDRLTDRVLSTAGVYRVDTEEELTEAVAAAKPWILIADNITLASDITTTSKVSFLPGKKLTIGTYTLTLNGGIADTREQIFNCDSTGRVTINTFKVPFFRPEWWGTSDIGVSVNQMIEGNAGGFTIVFGQGSYTQATSMMFDLSYVAHVYIKGAGKTSTQIIYTGTGPAIDVDYTDVVNHSFSVEDLSFYNSAVESGSIGIQWEGVRSGIIRNVKFTNIETDIYLVNTCYHCIIESTVHNGGTVGINVAVGCNENTITSPYFIQKTTSPFIIAGDGNVMITGDVEGYYNGGSIVSGRLNRLIRCWMERNSVSCDWLTVSGNGNVIDEIIVSTTASYNPQDPTYSAIKVTGENNTIIHPYFTTNVAYLGIHVTSAATGTRIKLGQVEDKTTGTNICCLIYDEGVGSVWETSGKRFSTTSFHDNVNNVLVADGKGTIENKITSSTAFGTLWTNVSARLTITADDATAPNGAATSADKLVVNNVTSPRVAIYGNALTFSGCYAFSFFVKSTTNDSCYVILTDSAGTKVSGYIPASSSWGRVLMVVNFATFNTASHAFGIVLCDPACAINDTYHLWQAQLDPCELGESGNCMILINDTGSANSASGLITFPV